MDRRDAWRLAWSDTLQACCVGRARPTIAGLRKLHTRPQELVPDGLVVAHGGVAEDEAGDLELVLPAVGFWRNGYRHDARCRLRDLRSDAARATHSNALKGIAVSDGRRFPVRTESRQMDGS
eukprot:352641-Chlamydomonas_euryale.AAC.1